MIKSKDSILKYIFSYILVTSVLVYDKTSTISYSVFFKATLTY